MKQPTQMSQRALRRQRRAAARKQAMQGRSVQRQLQDTQSRLWALGLRNRLVEAQKRELERWWEQHGEERWIGIETVEENMRLRAELDAMRLLNENLEFDHATERDERKYYQRELQDARVRVSKLQRRNRLLTEAVSALRHTVAQLTDEAFPETPRPHRLTDAPLRGASALES